MQKPLNVTPDFYNLVTQANIQRSSIQLSTVGLSSERVVTVNERKNNQNTLHTIDLQTKTSKSSANKAESVLPHPTLNYNAVRAKTPNNPSTTTILIYNMDQKKILTNS